MGRILFKYPTMPFIAPPLRTEEAEVTVERLLFAEAEEGNRGDE